MTTNETILTKVRRISQELSNAPARQRTKFTGALTTEIVREHLIQIGLPVSSRDIYIRGYTNEFDLAVVKDNNVKPVHGILYEPENVAAIIEVKYSGVYSKEVPETIKRLFDGIHKDNPHIDCVYLTVCENPSFKYGITSNTLAPHHAFTLCWVNRSDEILKIGDSFDSFAARLRNALK